MLGIFVETGPFGEFLCKAIVNTKLINTSHITSLMEKTATSVNVLKSDFSNVKDNAILVGFFKDRLNLSNELKRLDKENNGVVSSYIKDIKFKGEKGEARTIYLNKKIKHLVLVGLGEEDKYSIEVLSSTMADLSRKLRDSSFESFSILLSSFMGNFNEEEAVEKIVQSIILGTYKFTEFKTKDKDNAKCLKQATIIVNSAKNFDAQIKYGYAVAEAVKKTRELVNTPPNIATPEFIANYAKELSKKSDIKCSIFDEKQIEKMKMGCIHAVGNGSLNKPRFVVMEYKEGGKQKPIAIVGKGVTFDTGGYNLKPYPYILNMKDDKGGALAAIHIIEACARLKFPLNIIAITPLCENMIDAAAYRPDDVLKAYNGMTVEIKNTDAEGRLILADALAYASELKPQAIIEMASLTGASMVALGFVATPFLSTDEKLSEKVKNASRKSLEKVWEFPLWQEYEEQIKSDVADLKNISEEGDAGVIIGATFLKNFVSDVPWVHIDIGTTVWSKSEKGIYSKGGTGTPIRLMMEMLREWK